MREIKLIVIHCSATREDHPFTEHDLKVSAIISTFAAMAISSLHARSRGLVPTPEDTILIQLVFAMKVVWIVTG